MSIIVKQDCKPKLTLEFARSGRSACKTCLIKIPQGTIRIGVQVFHREKRNVPYTSWFHLNCLRLDHVPETLESAEQRYCEKCKEPCGINSITASVIERPGQYNLRHRIHLRCLAKEIGTSWPEPLDSDQKDTSSEPPHPWECLHGYDTLSRDGKQFVNSIFEHSGNETNVPITDFYESKDPSGASSSSPSSSSSSSSSTAMITIPPAILALHRRITNANNAGEKATLLAEMKVLMNADLAGETMDADFAAPVPPAGMRYCLIKRCFLEIFPGSSGISNYNKSSKGGGVYVKKDSKTKGNTKTKKRKMKVIEQETTVKITCDDCGKDCTLSSWYYSFKKKEMDYCNECANETVQKHATLQKNGVNVVPLKNKKAKK